MTKAEMDAEIIAAVGKHELCSIECGRRVFIAGLRAAADMSDNYAHADIMSEIDELTA